MNKKNIIFAILFFVVILFTSLFSFSKYSDIFSPKKNIKDIKYVKIHDKKVKVVLASTKEEQEKGLSGKKYIEKDEGMLFVFDHPQKYGFWMKDMNFSIDIIWIDSSLNIVFIKDNLIPDSFPEAFYPDVDSQYVLEVYGGFSEKNNLKIGEKIEFLPS